MIACEILHHCFKVILIYLNRHMGIFQIYWGQRKSKEWFTLISQVHMEAHGGGGICPPLGEHFADGTTVTNCVALLALITNGGR